MSSVTALLPENYESSSPVLVFPDLPGLRSHEFQSPPRSVHPPDVRTGRSWRRFTRPPDVLAEHIDRLSLYSEPPHSEPPSPPQFLQPEVRTDYSSDSGLSSPQSVHPHDGCADHYLSSHTEMSPRRQAVLTAVQELLPASLHFALHPLQLLRRTNGLDEQWQIGQISAAVATDLEYMEYEHILPRRSLRR